MLVALLHTIYKMNDLTIAGLREELTMFYDRMRSKKDKFKSEDKRNDYEESVLVAAFKGRCRGC